MIFPTTKTLISREAFEQLLHELFPKIYTYVRRRIQSHERAEEITQETFLRLWQVREKYDPKFPWSVWAYRIARNLVIDAFRKKQETLTERLDYEQTDSALLPDDRLAAEEERRRLLAALHQLPEHYYTILHLYYQEGLKLEAVAKVMKKSTRATTSLLHRARNRLKQMLLPRKTVSVQQPDKGET